MKSNVKTQFSVIPLLKKTATQVFIYNQKKQILATVEESMTVIKVC